MGIKTFRLQLILCLPVLIATTLAIPSGHAHAQACAPNPLQAIGWWPGDGNTTDIAGGHQAALAGSAAFGAGKVGQAFQFNGSGWVDVADSPAWTLGAHDFTIELWAKFNSLTGLDPLIAHTDGGGPTNKWIFWYNTSGHDKLLNTPALRFMTNEASFSGHDTVVAPWNPVVGQWYHLAVTRSGHTYTLYINGNQVATDTSPSVIPDPTAALTIGKAEAFRLNGMIDEPAIYTQALTAQKISEIFNAGDAGKCKPTFPIPEYTQASSIIATAIGAGAIAFVRKKVLQ